MTMKVVLEKSTRIIEELTELRKARGEFIDDHRKVFAKLEGLDKAEKALLDNLGDLASQAQFEEGVSTVPICNEFSFTRRANPLYARPGIFKWWKLMLEAGVVKSPSVTNVEKLLRKGEDQGGLPQEARKFLPSDDEKTYKNGVGKPKGW